MKRLQLYSLIIVLIFWTIASCYNLGEKILWTDEIVAVFASKHSLYNIIERSFTCDIHPPGYHYILKLIGSVCDSDAMLRLFSVACGFFSLIFIYRIASKLFSTNVGLWSTVLLASNTLFLSQSRQARPYTFLILIYELFVYFYIHSKINPYNFFVGLIFLAIAPLVHISSFLITFSIIVYMFYDRKYIFSIINKTKFTSLIFAVLVGFAYLFSLLILLKRREVEIGESGTFIGTTKNALNGINYVLSNIGDVNILTILAVAMFSFGLYVSFKSNGKFFIFTILYIFLPQIILIILRYASYSNPWHYLYIAPPFYVASAIAIERLCHNKVANRVFFGCIIFAVFCYQIYKNKHNIYNDDAKSIKQSLCNNILQHAKPPFLFEQEITMKTFARYNQNINEEFYRQKIKSDRESILLTAVGNNSLDNLNCQKIHGTENIFQCQISSNNIIDLSLQPETVNIEFLPDTYYRYVFTSEYLQVTTDFGGKLETTKNNVTGEATFRFRNSTETYPYVAAFVVDYEVKSPGSFINIYSRTDDGERKLVFSSGVRDKRSKSPIYMAFDAPFKTLDLILELFCTENNQGYGGNLDTVSIHKITGYFKCYRHE